jgi:hypothetical protein
MTQQPQQDILPRLPAPRLGRPGPYPGPYAVGYPGPNRPYPEPRRRPTAEQAASQPPPPAGLAAGVLGIAGALPLALFVGTAVARGGLWADTHVEWWLYPLLLAPVAQLVGAMALLSGRSWWLLVVCCLPATGLFGYLVYVLVARGDGLELGYYTFALGASPPAMVLAARPRARRWVTARRRARAAIARNTAARAAAARSAVHD